MAVEAPKYSGLPPSAVAWLEEADGQFRQDARNVQPHAQELMAVDTERLKKALEDKLGVSHLDHN